MRKEVKQFIAALVVLTVVVLLGVKLLVAQEREQGPVDLAAILAQEKPPAASAPAAKPVPTVAKERQLVVTGLIKDLRIAQLEAQAAQNAYTAAATELQKQVADLQVEGYDLDLNTFTYSAKKVK